MELTPGTFMFIIALSAVVNGLGIVRIVSSMGELPRQRESLDNSFYPISRVKGWICAPSIGVHAIPITPF